MHLKNLTVLGFKSFADKTSLNFQPGVTAIVGPNGCGKSNVSDAIRWVLGEQSAKALRGGEMADVIFNGTDRRKGLGMAEVSLTIDGVDQEDLRAAGVAVAYHEVTLTRRVFRDGGSEYFINRTPCRLKDIQQLFMGTGVGRTSYSIMAQGNITQILSSKPEDRRMIFEEAAGITRFKAQKKETLRRLEYTEQNLVRISDLLREVKRQIGSLQRQAGKARRYKQIMLELQHLETQLARHQYDQLQAEIAAREEAVNKLRTAIETGSESILRRENELAQLRQRLSELEHQVHQLQQEGLELKNRIDRHEGRIQFNEERLRELETQNATALAEINQAEERRQGAESELAVVTERLNASNLTLESHRESLAVKTAALREVEDRLRGKQEALRQAQSQSFAAAQQLSRARNEINALDLQKQGNQIRLEKLSAEKIQLEEERVRLEARLQEFAANVAAQSQNVLTQRGTLAERQQRLQEIQQELSRAAAELERVLRQQAEKRSHLNVLQQLQAEHHGFSAGMLAALKNTQNVLGSLADQIRVPDQYITAIETALGHHLQLVLTERPDAAQQILADLRAAKKGRAGIAALSLWSEAPTPVASSTGGLPAAEVASSGVCVEPVANASDVPPAVDTPVAPEKAAAGPETAPCDVASEPLIASPEVTPATSDSAVTPAPTEAIPIVPEPAPGVAAVSVVSAEPAVRNLLERLLGSTWIVADLAAATEAWRRKPGAGDFVTTTGELLTRHGVYFGGAGNGSGQTPDSILGRKNQVAALAEQLEELQRQIGERGRQKGALQGEQTLLQASLQQAQTELRAQEVAVATRQGEFNALQNSQRILNQKIETVVYEVQSLAAQEREGAGKRDALSARAQEWEATDQTLQQQVAEFSAGLDELRQGRDGANAALTEAKIALATEEQLSASFRRQREPLAQRIRELSQLAERRRGEIGSFLQRKNQAESEITEARGAIESLRHQREQLNAQTAELLTQTETEEAEIASREEGLRDQRRILAEEQHKRGNLEIELAQKNMAVQNLRDRVLQKYQLTLENIRSECITITIADEGPAKVQTLSPEEMAASGAATDWNAVGQQVSALQARIDEMGPVNLVAIEEYEETEQRHNFLAAQYEDLVKAKAQLVEVLSKINVQTKEMFTETFHKIRDNFRMLFTEIFGGGKADLILVEEGDVLESGIEIVARPPGKQLQTISLLSGGEQTMTAVALLFSIYQVKPSPFCVLDELDAPLDESNINRFIKVLQRFLVHSQFIIITHNKRTIGMADVLYGVTMQEEGVSKIVSVKFHKTGEAVTDHVPAALEPPPSAPEINQEEDRDQLREETLELAMAK